MNPVRFNITFIYLSAPWRELNVLVYSWGPNSPVFLRIYDTVRHFNSLTLSQPVSRLFAPQQQNSDTKYTWCRRPAGWLDCFFCNDLWKNCIHIEMNWKIKCAHCLVALVTLKVTRGRTARRPDDQTTGGTQNNKTLFHNTTAAWNPLTNILQLVDITTLNNHNYAPIIFDTMKKHRPEQVKGIISWFCEQVYY